MSLNNPAMKHEDKSVDIDAEPASCGTVDEPTQTAGSVPTRTRHPPTNLEAHHPDHALARALLVEPWLTIFCVG
jgi:hypothetical protein